MDFVWTGSPIQIICAVFLSIIGLVILVCGVAGAILCCKRRHEKFRRRDGLGPRSNVKTGGKSIGPGMNNKIQTPLPKTNWQRSPTSSPSSNVTPSNSLSTPGSRPSPSPSPSPYMYGPAYTRPVSPQYPTQNQNTQQPKYAPQYTGAGFVPKQSTITQIPGLSPSPSPTTSPYGHGPAYTAPMSSQYPTSNTFTPTMSYPEATGANVSSYQSPTTSVHGSYGPSPSLSPYVHGYAYTGPQYPIATTCYPPTSAAQFSSAMSEQSHTASVSGFSPSSSPSRATPSAPNQEDMSFSEAPTSRNDPEPKLGVKRLYPTLPPH